MPGTPIHCLRFRKLVIYYYLSAICARCKMEPPKGNVMNGKGGRGWASGQVTACPSSLSRVGRGFEPAALPRSAEHTSELQSLMRISYAVYCLKKNIVYRRQQFYNSHD